MRSGYKMDNERIKDLEKLLISFESVLNSPKEQDIHTFLEQNHDLLKIDTWGGFVSSKFKLADKYIPDFMTIGQFRNGNMLGSLITFIEIERANENLFTKAGDPTAFLTHAIKQVQDWKLWVSNNQEYLKREIQRLIVESKSSDENKRESLRWERDIYENFFYHVSYKYLVIAGRRASMTTKDRLILSQMNNDFHDINIITYDVLIDRIFRQLDPDPFDRF